MADDGSLGHCSLVPASATSVCYSRDNVLIPITFGENGQPIDQEAAQLSSLIGRLVKTYVPSVYVVWMDVPSELKEKIWKEVSSTYTIGLIHRHHIMQRANKLWKDWKFVLRRDHIYIYLMDAERKSHVPKYVKTEDWLRFVDISSTAVALAAINVGRTARSKMKSPHTTGRKGCARVAAELKAQRPNEPITRTDVFLATHKRKDGSSSSSEVDAVIIACESDKSMVESDIDNDAVAKVFGRDGKGLVLGLGMGVSKTAIQHSAPYKSALEEEHEANTHLQTQVKQLKEEIDEIKQVLSQGGTQHSSTCYESSSQAQDGSPREEVCMGTNQSNTSHTREGSCRLLSYLKKDITVAVGRVMGLSIDEGGCYRIVIDGILKADELLLGRDMTFGDLSLGDIISWPIFRIVPE